jgi:hypothetical protein
MCHPLTSMLLKLRLVGDSSPTSGATIRPPVAGPNAFLTPGIRTTETPALILDVQDQLTAFVPSKVVWESQSGVLLLCIRKSCGISVAAHPHDRRLMTDFL